MSIEELIETGSESVRSVVHYMQYMDVPRCSESDPFSTAKIYLLTTLADVLEAQTAVATMKAGLFQPAPNTRSQELVVAAGAIVCAFEHRVEAAKRFIFAASQVLECATHQGKPVGAQFVRFTELAKKSIASIDRFCCEQLLTEFAGQNIVD